MASHMVLDERKAIAHGLECRLTFAQMATMFGRAVSTIANEVKNRMRWSNKGYGRTNAVCEHFETCSKVYRNADGRKAPFKSQKRCFARTSQTTTRIFNMLQDVAGLEFFMTLFPAVLADNGPEFSNPKMVEFFRPDPKHNPTRLERRT